MARLANGLISKEVVRVGIILCNFIAVVVRIMAGGIIVATYFIAFMVILHRVELLVKMQYCSSWQ